MIWPHTATVSAQMVKSLGLDWPYEQSINYAMGIIHPTGPTTHANLAVAV